MKKRYLIASICGVTLLTAMLLLSLQKNNEYEAYLQHENENSISAILSSINAIDEVFKSYEETDEMTYAQLSRIGSLLLGAEYELVDLYKQLSFYMSDDEYSDENFNTVIRYFDGISVFISRNVLQDYGNYYPQLYNERVYELNEDEILILDHMADLNQEFIDLISNEGLVSDKGNFKEYDINLDDYNGLGDLIDLIDVMARVSNEHIREFESFGKTDLVEDYLSRVSLFR